MNQTELNTYAQSLRDGLFADRENFSAALSTAYGLIATLPKQDHITAFTALHIVLNTIANDLTKE